MGKGPFKHPCRSDSGRLFTVPTFRRLQNLFNRYSKRLKEAWAKENGPLGSGPVILPKSVNPVRFSSVQLVMSKVVLSSRMGRYTLYHSFWAGLSA